MQDLVEPGSGLRPSAARISYTRNRNFFRTGEFTGRGFARREASHEPSIGERRISYYHSHERQLPGRGWVFHAARNVLKGTRSQTYTVHGGRVSFTGSYVPPPAGRM
jgi:hypothetical protein